MPTIYNRLKVYCSRTNSKMLPLHKRIELGRLIIQHYINKSKIKKAVHRAISKEPEGKVIVLSYPKEYVPTIDKMVKDFYRSNKRKRIPLNRALHK